MKAGSVDKGHLIDGRYGIGDVVDLRQLRRIFEGFSEATGFTVGFLDHPGMNILIAAGWRDICIGFHRSCPASEAVCAKSNRRLLDRLDEAGKVVTEPCGHGLVDCATPIIVKGKHIASLATGQLFLKEPDLEWFKRRARLFGFDEEAYLKAVKEVPVVSEERLRIVTALLGEIALILSRNGYTNLIAREKAERLANEISRRRLLEEELERERTQLLTIFEQMAAEVSVLDPRTHEILFVNRHVRKIYGQDVLGRFCYDVFHGYDAPCPSCNNELLLGMKEGEFIQREVFSEPVGRYYLETNNLIRWPDGRCVKLEISIDATDKVQAEKALKESEAKYQFLAEGTADVIFTLDPDGMVTYVSPSIARMLGYDPEEILGQKMDRNLTPESRELFSETLAELKCENEVGADADPSLTVELVCYHKDAAARHLATCVRGIRDGDGNLMGFYGSHHDITERQRTEEALRESQELFSLFMRHSPVYTFIKEVTPTESRVLQASDNYAEMIGIPGPEMIGRTMEELFPPEFAAKITADDWEVVASGKVLQLDEDLNGRNYTTIKFPIIRQGRNLLAGYTIDITDRRRAEEERRMLEERLQHADKMEAVGTLAGGIAHDFNNLLMGIQGYTSLMLLELDPAHPHYERLKRIEEQVQSGAGLTRQLLGFARGGRYEVKPAEMNEILEKSSTMFGRTKKEITIHRKLAAGLRPVEVDRGQMEQVLMNLYVNAWQAMPGGGEISLETENIFLEDEEALSYSVAPGEYVKITVTDTGTGMDEKTKARIFDPFFTTKGMGRGTGLGLASVYGIIKGHKGMVDVESEPSRGTTFRIYLPASEKAVEREKTEMEPIAKGRETILLADDEKMVLEVSREMLEFLGYRVYAVGSGQEAVAVYQEKQQEIDLVILDMIMPGISGGETFDRLRRIDTTVKVLLSSGYSINGEAKTIMDRGCNGFIQKPFQMERLSGKIREVLENQAANEGRDRMMS
ncbi:MAG: PocR ligand-binding domain-containing protein [Deltaproteobacteria bacterium]|nr:PocR ligand-binding domain-containing protein [Deltaproteobacteria bacterium]